MGEVSPKKARADDPRPFHEDAEPGELGSQLAGTPHNTGWAISSNGRAPTIDTVRTDASGRYVLESEHFCPSALVFRAEGYTGDSSFHLGCPSPDGTIVDVALTPLASPQ
jgi:hypothetical protein